MTGNYQEFTGDDSLFGFEKLVGSILIKTELGGVSDGYHLEHAGLGDSGYSFGGNQLDLGQGRGRDLLVDILINATDDLGQPIFADGNQFYIDNQAAILSQGNPNALTQSQINQISLALSSNYGKAAINLSFTTEVSNAISHVDQIINDLPDGNIKTTLENSEELRSILIDYHNQFGLVSGLKMDLYLSGDAIQTYQGNTLQLDGMITSENLWEFIQQTLYATQNPTAYEQRQTAVIETLIENQIGKYLSGNDQSQVFHGSDFNDEIHGNGGDDILDGRIGIDKVFGDDGDDTISFTVAENSFFSATDEELHGGSGTDTLTINLSSSELTDALKDDILAIYQDWKVNQTGTEKTYDFNILRLSVDGFENLQVFVDYQLKDLATVAKDDKYSLLQNGTCVGNLFTDTGYGADHTFGSSLTASAGTYTTVSGGTITIQNDGAFAFSSATNFFGVDSYNYQVIDTAGGVTYATSYFHVQQQIAGTDVDDVIFATYNPINVNAGDGDDQIVGSEYSDYINGGSGNDNLNGSIGGDVILGGDGNDIIGAGSYSYISYNQIIDENSILYGDDGDDTITSLNGYIKAYGGNGNDTIDHGSNIHLNSISSSELHGGDGNDHISIGNVGLDIVYGDSGNDLLHISGFNDVYTYFGITLAQDKLYGGDGIDTVDGSGLFHDSYFDLGNGYVQSQDYIVELFDVENAAGSIYNDTLIGNAVNNTIWGGSGNDYISGSDGNDTLIGDTGNDTMQGGSGSDIFVFNDYLSVYGQGIDNIIDFNTSESDKLDISELLSEFFVPNSSLIQDFVSFSSASSNAEVTMSVDRDGQGSNFTFEDMAVFANTSSMDVNMLFNNGNIIV